MAFFSSIMSALECLLLGMEHMEIVLTFSFACFVTSLLGLFVVQRAVRLYRSASLIAFSVGIVMALSTGLIARFGAVKTCNEWNRRELGIFWDNANRVEHVSLQEIDPTDKFCDVCSFVGRTVKFLDLER